MSSHGIGDTFSDLLDVLGVDEDDVVVVSQFAPDKAPELGDRGNAEHFAARLPDDRNVYFNVQPLRSGIQGGRGKAADVVGIRAIYCDLDIKPGSFDTLEQARTCVDRVASWLGTSPCYVTQSGGGLHAYWRVVGEGTSWAHSDDASRQRAQSFLRSFEKVVSDKAQVKVDTGVFELARVLRVPGSFNNKPGEPRRACIGEVLGGRDLDYAALEARLLAYVPSKPSAGVYDAFDLGATGERFNSVRARVARGETVSDRERMLAEATRLAGRPNAVAELRAFGTTLPGWDPSKPWTDADLTGMLNPVAVKFGLRADPEPQVETLTESRVISRLTDYPWNSDGDGERLLAWLGGNVRFNELAGYLHWDGKVWRADPTGHRVMRAARDCARATQEAALAAAEQMPNEEAEDKRARRSFIAWHSGVGNLVRLEAAIKLLKSSRGTFVVTSEQLDADPDLLTLRNGTVNLRTGLLREHRREDLLTAYVDEDKPTDRVPAGDWQAFIDSSMPDIEMRAYLQRLIGYSMTGYSGEQMFAVHQGAGANGKSTMFRALDTLFGDVTKNVAVKVFLGRGHDDGGASATPQLAVLAGARLVLTTEPGAGAKLNEDLVKQMSGNDRIVARRLYGSPESYAPKFVIHMLCNDAPSIQGVDDGIWRRLHLVRWTQSFTVDPTLDGRLARCRAEILQWVLDGAAAWNILGLCLPDSARFDVADMRGESDRLAGFVPLVMVPASASFVSSTEVYASYLEWQGKNEGRSLAPMGKTALCRALALKVERSKVGDVRGFKAHLVPSFSLDRSW